MILPILFLIQTTMMAQTSPQPSLQPALSISVSAPSKQVASGNEMKIRIVLTNTSEHPIKLARIPGPNQPELYYKANVLDSKGNPVPRKKVERDDKGGNLDSPLRLSIFYFVLKPGESREEWIIPTDLYDLEKPGDYTIQIQRNDKESKTIVKSNVISVTVIPQA